LILSFWNDSIFYIFLGAFPHLEVGLSQRERGRVGEWERGRRESGRVGEGETGEGENLNLKSNI